MWRRLRFLVDQARLFEASQSADLVEFVAWAELQRSDMARVHEPLLPESDDHAVRIMTMHGAKGLEFPITVLSGSHHRADGASQARLQVYWEATAVFVIARQGVSHPVASTGGPTSKRRWTDDEKLRLLYVACTRARDHLLVAAHHRSDVRADSFARLLWNASPRRRPARGR